MKAYSMDLGQRVWSAVERGSMTRPGVAEEFGVSLSFVAKLLRREREEGTLAGKPRGGNRPPRRGSGTWRRCGGWSRRLVRGQPDATPAELRDRLKDRRGVGAGVWMVCRALGRGRLRLPLKKSRYTRRNGTRPGCGGCAGRSPAS